MPTQIQTLPRPQRCTAIRAASIPCPPHKSRASAREVCARVVVASKARSAKSAQKDTCRAVRCRSDLEEEEGERAASSAESARRGEGEERREEGRAGRVRSVAAAHLERLGHVARVLRRACVRSFLRARAIRSGGPSKIRKYNVVDFRSGHKLTITSLLPMPGRGTPTRTRPSSRSSRTAHGATQRTVAQEYLP